MIESIVRSLIVGTLLGFIKKHVIYRRRSKGGRRRD
jgi:hypothetical protein